MKRLTTSPDSLGALMSICPNSTVEVDDEQQQGLYSREFQTMLEGLDGDEGCCVVEEESAHKKRRLNVDQVKALEKNFEVENKLEPERKVKLAQELGLQPRQVAVWFQNRRARWKTKQLERDYGVLKANHDSLRLKFEALQKENDSLLNQIEELKRKVGGDEEVTPDGRICDPVKEEEEEGDDGNSQMLLGSFFEDLKDGSSDSDSSAILNEEIANNSGKSKNEDHHRHHHQQEFVDIHSGCSSGVKIEEHNLFGEESCSTLFSDEQAPTLSWCCSHVWN